MRLILASASPRRRELLQQVGIIPDEIVSPDINEIPFPKEAPKKYCRRMAKTKADKVQISNDEIVIAADTVVSVGTMILGKPVDAESARKFLLKLSGRRHRVITSVAVKTTDRHRLRDVVTIVKMKRLSHQELDTYIASREWEGRAGGYAIQGRGGAFIPWLQGSFPSVVGLPIAETVNLLVAAGYPYFAKNDQSNHCL